MNDKKAIKSKLATVEKYVSSIFDLLNAAEDSHYECTLNGWLNEYEQNDSVTQEQSALIWMWTHYDGAAATTHAARDLAEVAREQLNRIWLELDALFSEETTA